MQRLDLILASSIWHEIFAAGFHFCDMYFLQFREQIKQKLFIIPSGKKIVSLGAHN